MAGEDIEPRVIYKDYSDDPALDFAFLRSKGIELIQKLSGTNWTDFNIHDPGVTILETLCYAITDLAYRTDFPINDLLSDEKGTIDNKANSFVPHNEILSTSPVFVNDFRKLVIDAVPEVVNVWLQPVKSAFTNAHVKGLYQVIIQADYEVQQGPGDQQQQSLEKSIVDKVRKTLVASRVIGEDFDEFIVLRPQFIEVSAQIIINKNAVAEELLAQVYHRIEKSLNQRVTFFSEQELKAKGYTAEQIYSGPLLKKGIIPDEELKEIKPEVDASELVKTVSEMTDVIHIRMFEIREAGASRFSSAPVKLHKHHYPVLKFDPSSPGIELYHDHLLLPVKSSVFFSMLQRLHDFLKRDFVSAVHSVNTHQSIQGVYRNIGEYTSIQEMFPSIYRIGREGIEENASVVRKAQTKQLKGYLLFFEQIIAGYLAQLSNVGNLFSADITNESHSYFFQPLYMVPGIAPLIKAFTRKRDGDWLTFENDQENEYVKGIAAITEPDENFRTRKNKLFDHLLSRFNIIPDNYPVKIYQQLYHQHTEEARIDEELKWKSALLSNVLNFTCNRVKGMNYLEHNLEEVHPGFGYNLRLLLHLKLKRHILSEVISMYLNERVDGKDKPGLSTKESLLRTVSIEGEELHIITEKLNDKISSSFNIKQQSLKFLKDGINRSNYRIIPGLDDLNKYLILYKTPEEQNWAIIREYHDKKSAKQGLALLIETLLKINIESEGFHIVEHVLLAPLRNNKVFGFSFYDKSGNVVLKQKHRVSFYEREEVIRGIISIAKEADINNPIPWIKQLQDISAIVLPQSYKGTQSIDEMDYSDVKSFIFGLLTSLKTFKKQQTKYYPRFEFDVMHWDESIIVEDFFNEQVTVVFPAWPVRFQQQGFREFAESTFINNLPVHIKARFLWLNISKMRRFEELYFRWLASLKEDNVNIRRIDSFLFVPFLYNELKSR